MLVNRSFGDSLEAEVLYVATFNRGDYMVRPKVVWQMDPVWRLQGAWTCSEASARGFSAASMTAIGPMSSFGVRSDPQADRFA